MTTLLKFFTLTVLIAASLSSCSYVKERTKRHSPEDTVMVQTSDFEAQVFYCRPYKKGRLIFGEKSTDAKVPYGEYWRLGANEATEIEFSKNVLFGDVPVNKGRYVMYAIPGADEFILVLNTETGRWGAREADTDRDIARYAAKVVKLTSEVEQFTFRFTEAGDAVILQGMWADVSFQVPISPQ